MSHINKMLCLEANSDQPAAGAKQLLENCILMESAGQCPFAIVGPENGVVAYFRKKTACLSCPSLNVKYYKNYMRFNDYSSKSRIICKTDIYNLHL